MTTPGMMIRDALARRGWEQRTMAIVCDWSESKVSRMISDETQMSAADALIVAEVLPELSAEALLSAQSEFELARARLLYRPKSVALPRTDSERYAELRKLVEAWQQWQREPRYDPDNAPERLLEWSHR